MKRNKGGSKHGQCGIPMRVVQGISIRNACAHPHLGTPSGRCNPAPLVSRNFSAQQTIGPKKMKGVEFTCLARERVEQVIVGMHRHQGSEINCTLHLSQAAGCGAIGVFGC